MVFLRPLQKGTDGGEAFPSAVLGSEQLSQEEPPEDTPPAQALRHIQQINDVILESDKKV